MTSAPETESLTCPVCLGVFEDPRMLPQCHHTFCIACIKDVADRHLGGAFPCPSCRTETNLPTGGVVALQKNFYIKAEDLSRARQGVFHCSVHSDQRLDMYCCKCQKVMCLKCVLTKHKTHDTIDLPEAAASATIQLEADKIRLERAITKSESKIQATTKEQEALRGKKDSIERDLRSRYAVVVAEATRNLEEQLTSLNKISETAESSLSANLKQEQQNKMTLRHLQKRLQDALSNDLPCSLVDVAKEMKEGDGSKESVRQLVPEERKQLVRPVLRCVTTKIEDVAEHIHNYFGTVHKMDIKCNTADNTKVERFNITEEPGSEVFSICVKDNGSIVLSYTWHKGSRTACAEEFDSRGRHARTFNTATGKTSFKSKGQSCMFDRQNEQRFVTNSKSKEHFSLHNNLSSGEATVKKTTITSEDPFKTKDNAEFTIQCGPHRAFDVDSTGQYFVIVEESQTSDSERKVRLFKRPQEETTAKESQDSHKRGAAASHSGQTKATYITYSPPNQPFEPSDVCFYQKGSQTVLLIADEINDAIHVVRVMSYKLEFAGYLCPGHPLLVQPTALTVDSRNRVWVACRGRVVLIVEPDMDIFLDMSAMKFTWGTGSPFQGVTDVLKSLFN